MSITQSIKNKDGLVLFAGAGCSIAPPSALPGWNDLNSMILEALWDRVEEYRMTKGLREKILSSIKQKRDEHKFPPDYQAQLMAERVGINYFNLLSVVDADRYNPVQYYTALLAKEGRVKAVVTTNFDQNFERAFSEVGIAYQVYFDEDAFQSLTTNTGETIPIIKIHGCCSSASSMVDTRKQRLKGRSKILEKVLQQLLHKYHFIFGGFSGQDFDDNDNYLGFKEAASKAVGFTYLCFPGSTLRQSMDQLIQYYGSHKAKSIEYDPAIYLEELLVELGVTYQPFQVHKNEKVPIKQKLANRVTDLQPMDAVNMITVLTESYGDEVSARFLYDKTWKNRNLSDYEGEGIARFLLNHGRSFVFNFQDRFERAQSAGVAISSNTIGEPLPGMEDYFNNPAKQSLLHTKMTSPEALGLIGLAQTYMGKPILFKNFPNSLAERFKVTPTAIEIADITYYYSLYANLYGKFKESLLLLSAAIKDMEAEFDEPRLSRLLSRRALMKFRGEEEELIQSGKNDADRARALAEKYHEPSLLALSALSSASYARKKIILSKPITLYKRPKKNTLH